MHEAGSHTVLGFHALFWLGLGWGQVTQVPFSHSQKQTVIFCYRKKPQVRRQLKSDMAPPFDITGHIQKKKLA